MADPQCLAGSIRNPECAAERFKSTIAERERQLAAANAEIERLRGELEAARKDAERMRKKFDQLLPGEHVWHLPDETIKWTYCAICLTIQRTDGANSPCKGLHKLKLRDAALAAEKK